VTSPRLSVSVVVYRPDLEALHGTMTSLREALGRARERDALDSAAIWVVDNGSSREDDVDRTVAAALEPVVPWLELRRLRGHGNVGFGRGHDLAIEQSRADYHLVLNPDVVLDPDAIVESLRYMGDHPNTGIVTPHVVDAGGQRQYLCKRRPSIFVLWLRGFAPAAVRERFRARLDHYEMRDLPEEEVSTGVPIASGCFMFARTRVLREVGGFTARYFLYFEDFDLSLRVGRMADIAYVPRVRIVHTGGDAARKGWAHRRMFIRSAFTFFSRNGWKLR
jgi:GT2 family glycosyltransferase